jgi:hypothetical protein
MWTGKCWCCAAKVDIPGDICINNISDLGCGILRPYEVLEAWESSGLFLAMGAVTEKG